MAKAWKLKSSWYRYPSFAQTRGRADPQRMKRLYSAWGHDRLHLPAHEFKAKWGY